MATSNPNPSKKAQRTTATRGHGRRFAGVLLCAASVAFMWWFFVGTRIGQLVDAIAMEAMSELVDTLGGYDKAVLGTVSVPSVVIIMVLAAVVALCRLSLIHI